MGELTQHWIGLEKRGAQVYTAPDLTRKQPRFSQMSILVSCLIKSLRSGSFVQYFWSSKFYPDGMHIYVCVSPLFRVFTHRYRDETACIRGNTAR